MESENFKGVEDNFQRYKENVADLTQEFELGLFLYLLNKIKWYIILIITIASACGFIYLRYTPEIYSTSALIQVSVKNQPSEFNDFYSFKSSTNLNAELALFKSQKSINKVIKNLDLKIFYYSEGEVLTRFLYSSSPYKLENYSIKDQSIKSLPIYINFDGKYFSLSDKKKEIYYAEYIEPNKFFSSDYISGKIKTSQNLYELTKSFDQTSSMFLRIPEKKEIINEIVNGLQLNIQDHSAHTISISHQHTNALFSKDICNSLIDVYMSYDLEKKKLSSDKIVEFINIQKDSVKKRLVDSEKKLRKFKKYNKYNNEELELKNIQNKTSCGTNSTKRTLLFQQYY